MDGILEEFYRVKANCSDFTLKLYDFGKMERILTRLLSFSECSECKGFLKEFEIVLKELEANPSKPVNKSYTIFIKNVTEHLQKSHQLIPEGYYTNMYLAMGMCFGLPFGLIFSAAMKQYAYMGIGMTIGMAIGMGIGSSKDQQAKKDGLVI